MNAYSSFFWKKKNETLRSDGECIASKVKRMLAYVSKWTDYSVWNYTTKVMISHEIHFFFENRLLITDYWFPRYMEEKRKI